MHMRISEVNVAGGEGPEVQGAPGLALPPLLQQHPHPGRVSHHWCFREPPVFAIPPSVLHSLWLWGRAVTCIPSGPVRGRQQCAHEPEVLTQEQNCSRTGSKLHLVLARPPLPL